MKIEVPGKIGRLLNELTEEDRATIMDFMLFQAERIVELEKQLKSKIEVG